MYVIIMLQFTCKGVKGLEYVITAADEGKMLRELLRKDLSLSSGLMRRLKTIPAGITLDGQPVTVRATVRAGQVLRLKSEDRVSSPNIEPAEGKLDIVYEDGDLIIINKPFGMPVHPSPGHGRDTVANIMAYRAGQKGEALVFRAVNRLDSGTGGLMCVAKNARAGALLSTQMGEKSIRRVYEAVVCGEVKEDSGTVDLPIGLKPGSGIKRCVREDGESAVTHYRVLERANGLSRVELELETGRTHQIRVHFAHLGHPVWGDFMYGVEQEMRGWALFSKSLTLRHPTTNEEMVFEVPTPEFYEEIMARKASNE